MNKAQRELLVKTLSDLGKGGLIAVFVAVATEKMDPWAGAFGILGALNSCVIAHNLLSEEGNGDEH